jgi:hypothetical protein
MFDRHVHTAPAPPPVRSRAWVWAASSLIASVGIAYWSNYASRRDEHAHDADACGALSDILTAGAYLMIEHARAAEMTIRKPVPADKGSNKFVLPPLEAIFRGQEKDLGLLDKDQQKDALRLEFLYRDVRDDISNTPELYHTGDTFGITVPGDKPLYLNLLNAIDQQAQRTIQQLANKQPCAVLAATSFLHPGPRRRS